MATLTITMTLTAALKSDFGAQWLSQKGGAIGTLSAPVAAADASITLGQQVNIPAGATIVIDNEPIPVSGAVVSSATVPLGTRGQALGIAATTHTSGSSVYILDFPTPFAKFNQECIQPYMQGIANSLANQGNSSVFPSSTGTAS